MVSSGTLYIISAPSGGGKTSLVKALLTSVDNLVISVSHTTRPQRPGEKNGLNYHFVSVTEFKALITEEAFLEHAIVFNHYYGTSKQWLANQLAQGYDVILEIDWQGARQVRALVPDSISIFILPPSRDVLFQRLQDRAQDDPDVIAQRMARASNEMQHYQEYDYLLMNNDFTTALSDLCAIIQAQRLLQSKQRIRHAGLIAHLLAV